MLTFFTTAKPFLGHSAIIQRNALESWTLLHPHVEVILFGDDQGAAETARSIDIHHEPYVERNACNSKRLDYMFQTARTIASHDILCYINCDILLMNDFLEALARVQQAHSRFLMIGRRWDTRIDQPYDFAQPDWQARLRQRALSENRQRPPQWIDYFCFSRPLYASEIPPFVIGRVFWDNWLVWNALHRGHAVVDVSRSVLAVHQDHDYGYHPQGQQGVFHGEESGRNLELAGGWRHLRTIADANEVLSAGRLYPNHWRHWTATRRWLRQAGRVLLYNVIHPIWFLALGLTRPLRSTLRLRAKSQPRS